MECEVEKIIPIDENTDLYLLKGKTVYDVVWFTSMNDITALVKIYPGKWTQESLEKDVIEYYGEEYGNDLIERGFEWE